MTVDAVDTSIRGAQRVFDTASIAVLSGLNAGANATRDASATVSNATQNWMNNGGPARTIQVVDVKPALSWTWHPCSFSQCNFTVCKTLLPNPYILQDASNKTETTLIRIESAAVHALAPAIQAVSYLLAPRTPSSPGDANVLEPPHVSRAPAPAPQSALATMQVCFLGAQIFLWCSPQCFLN